MKNFKIFLICVEFETIDFRKRLSLKYKIVNTEIVQY